mmetsp:Transcript_31011/g.87330  ORF Transcript_31011/g.87330 Transcript_31011/m.87330 type:complete len:92 (-) Transcript_31011:69-344(-)
MRSLGAPGLISWMCGWARGRRVDALRPGFNEAAAKRLAANAPGKGLADMHARAGFGEAASAAAENPEARYTVERAQQCGPCARPVAAASFL